MPHVLFLQDPSPARLSGVGPFLRDYWPILLPVILGLVSIYWLLPRAGRRFPPLVGAIAGGLALVLAGVFLVRTETVWPETLLFYAFAGIAVLGGALLVTQRNPVYAALSFALVILSTCGLFLLQAAPFLMAATIIIYAGAIVVTFLFVIMLAQQAGYSTADLWSREPFLGTLAGFVLTAAVLCVLYRTIDTRDLDQLTAQVERLSEARTEDDVRRAMTHDAAGRTVVLADRLATYLPGNPAALDVEANWTVLASEKATEAQKKTAVEMIRRNAKELLPELRDRRAAHGTLAVVDPAANPAGEVKDVRRVPGRPGDIPGQLPARNVAALGQSLFTDFLIPVGLAAVLLLAATIGAIAVAGRRPDRAEDLR